MRPGIGDPLHALVEVVEDPHERSIVSVERHRRHVLGDASTHDVNKGRRSAGRSGRWSIEFVGRRRSNIPDHWSRRRADNCRCRCDIFNHMSRSRKRKLLVLEKQTVVTCIRERFGRERWPNPPFFPESPQKSHGEKEQDPSLRKSGSLEQTGSPDSRRFFSMSCSWRPARPGRSAQAVP